MTDNTSKSPWRIPLVRELAVILLLKLVILFGIKAIWFTAPVEPENGVQLLDSHLFAPPAPQSIAPAKENSR